MGIIRLMLRSLALMVVQRHIAASKSTRPSSTGQHSSLALLPIPMWTSPPNTSTHAPNLRVSMGQVSCFGGGSIGGTGMIGGVTGGFGGGRIGGVTGGFGGFGGGFGGFIGGVTGGFGGLGCGFGGFIGGVTGGFGGLGCGFGGLG
uniref:Uncharacterized protein n=1 Tax=Salix viminalis TaxID=40686 RepID=A0A6N2KCG4_SALVM